MTNQPEPADLPDTAAAQPQVPEPLAALLATPCATCEHTLNWHRHHVGCIARGCGCGRFEEQPDAEADEAGLTAEQQVRGVQAWMALDLHQALGWPVDHGATVVHQGRKSWSDWWAELLAGVRNVQMMRRYRGELPAPAAVSAAVAPPTQAADEAALAPLKAKARELEARRRAEHRAAVLREAADALDEFLKENPPTTTTASGWRGAWAWLRRMADETATETPAAGLTWNDIIPAPTDPVAEERDQLITRINRVRLALQQCKARGATGMQYEIAVLEAIGDRTPHRGPGPLCHETDPRTLRECALRAKHKGDHRDGDLTWTAAGARQDEVWPVKEATRRYAETLRATPGQAAADGHTGWECDAGAHLLISATTPGPGALGTHHGTIYACPVHQGAALQRITGSGYQADPQPAPPGHRWNPWPCGHVTAHDAQALTALTAAGARQDGAQP